MPNEDFRIKTGVDVDDGGVGQLQSIAEELEKTAKALQKINNVKFNGDIFSGLTNAGKNIQNVTKEIDKLQKSAKNVDKPISNIGNLFEKSFVTKNKRDATSQLRESYKERLALQKSVENTEDKNSVWFSKEYLEADYKYLQSIKEATAKGINKSTFDKYTNNSFYKYGASDIEDDLKEASLALQDYYSTIDEIKKENKIDFIPKDIENKITQVVRAKSNLRNQLDNDPDYWKDSIKFWKDDIKYDIDNLKFDGKLTPPKIDTSNITETKQEIEDTKKDLSAISSGEYSLLDVASIDAIKNSMESIATSAQNLKETLGSEVTSGLMTQINEMLTKKDELQNLANILKSNKEDLNKAAKATGSNKNKNVVPTNIYEENSLSWLNSGKEKLEKMYGGKAIGTSISQADNGVVKLTTSLKTAEGQWLKLSAKIDDSGNILSPKYTDVTDAKQIDKFEKSLTAVASGEKIELSLDEMRSKETEVRSILKEVYGDAEKFDTQVNTLGQVSISKVFPDGDEISNLNVQYENVDKILEKYKTSANKVKDIQEMLSSASIKTSNVNKKSTNNTSSSTSTKTPKYTTDESYIGDLKYLMNTEAESQIIDKYITDTKRWQSAIDERNKIKARANSQSAQNSTEQNTENKYEDMKSSVAKNLNKYDEQIHQAYTDLSALQQAKSGIQGLDKIFESGEREITKWASAVANGKMSIETFVNKVSGLKTSISSIGKVIDPDSITDAKGELETYLREITQIEDITFSGFTSKNGIATLKGTFKDSAGEAQTLTVQLNTLNGQIKNLGTSVKPAETGLSKFFSGWKEKMVNLAQYLTSFRAMNQVWTTFKQGLEIVKEFDTALTEMRKVSDEPISKLKEFQKESFDMAKSVGTTALQIQNSTADFMRLGQSMEEAKQSSVNANILKNVSEFDNINDATSALISMQAAYKDLTQTELIDKLDNIGNRYAVSTDELATGLQKSGATLSLMGNNIDESVALLTAANSQIQNIDTVAAGEKVISLRIAGRSCLNILKGMGEYLYSLVDNYIGGGLGTDNTEVRPIFI